MESFEDMVGATIASIEGLEVGSDQIKFIFDDGNFAVLTHEQDCCEDVTVDDVVGDVSDLIDTPVLVAEERGSDDDTPRSDYDESWTWTFYEIRTIKGSVTIKWYGSSNGYYSESVDFFYNKTGYFG